MKVETYRSDEIRDTETCEFCTGYTAIRKANGELETSRELCESTGMCTATIDWEDRYWRSRDGA